MNCGKLLLALLALGIAPALYGQTTTLSGAAAPPPAANVTTGATNHAVLAFDLTRSGMGAPVFLDGLDATQTGTAVVADIAQWRLFHDINSNGTLDRFIDLPLATSTSLNPSFTGFAALLPSNLARSFIVAVDVDAAATLGGTIILSLDDTQVSVSSGTTAGGNVTSNTMTIAPAAPQPDMLVERGGNPIPDGITGVDHLGNVDMAGATFHYDILNNGAADLTLTGSPDAVLISNEINCTVAVTQPALLTIPASTQTPFSLAITPSGPPLFSCLVSIPSNDPGTPYTFVVQGTAVPLHLVIATQPGGGAGGAAWTQQPVVEIHDSSNMPAAGFNGFVSASITSATGTPGATLLGAITVQASAGVATFTDLAIDLAGTGYTLTFNSGVLTPVVSATFDITGGAGVALRVANQPGGAAMASPFVDQPVIEIVDAGGNVDTTDNTTMVSAAITASTGTSGAVLGGTTSVQAVNGVVTFTNLAIDLAGNGYTLDFTATGFTTAVSDPFNVAGAAADLAIGQEPGRAVFNTPFLDQPIVEIHDAGGNVVTSDNSTVVTAALVAGTGTLGGTLTATAVNGVATFTNLQIDTAGLGFEIGFTSAPALTPATSAPFDVAGVATQLGIRTQPGDARAGQVLGQQPVIEIQDANGVLVATDNTTQVAVALGAGGPSGATLGGTLTVTAVDGVATFTDIEIDMPGTYTLDFSDTAATLTGVTSDPFRVRGGPFFPPGCAAHADGAYAALLVVMGVLALVALRRRSRV